MAAFMTEATIPSSLAVFEDDMEMSSDLGRQDFHQDDIDIDIDFGDGFDATNLDDAMIDDAVGATEEPFQVYDYLQDDEMIDEEEEAVGTLMVEEQMQSAETAEHDEELHDVDVEDDEESDVEIIEESALYHMPAETTHSPSHPEDIPSNLTISDAPSLRQSSPAPAAVEEPQSADGQKSEHGTSDTLAVEAQSIDKDLSQGPQTNLGDTDATNLDLAPVGDEREQPEAEPEVKAAEYSDRRSTSVEDAANFTTIHEGPPALEDDSANVVSVMENSQHEEEQANVVDDGVLPRPVTHGTGSGADSSHHPVIVTFEGQEMDLFPVNEAAEDYLLTDRSLIDAKLSDFLGSCRIALGESITDTEELEIEIEELALSLSEDSTQTSYFSLGEVLGVYSLLCENDGNTVMKPLYITLAKKLRFTARMMDLSAAANRGHGFHYLQPQVAAVETDAFEPVEDDLQHLQDDQEAPEADQMEMEGHKEESYALAGEAKNAGSLGLNANEHADAAVAQEDDADHDEDAVDARAASEHAYDDPAEDIVGRDLLNFEDEDEEHETSQDSDENQEHDEALHELVDWDAQEDEAVTASEPRGEVEVDVDVDVDEADDIASSSGTATLQGEYLESTNAAKTLESSVQNDSLTHIDGAEVEAEEDLEYPEDDYDEQDDIEFPPDDDEYPPEVDEPSETYVHVADASTEEVPSDVHDDATVAAQLFQSASKALTASGVLGRKRSRETEVDDVDDSDSSAKKVRGG